MRGGLGAITLGQAATSYPPGAELSGNLLGACGAPCVIADIVSCTLSVVLRNERLAS